MAELTLAKTQLTGYAYCDWYIRNQITDLEMKIADLKRWLAEAGKDNGNRDQLERMTEIELATIGTGLFQ